MKRSLESCHVLSLSRLQSAKPGNEREGMWMVYPWCAGDAGGATNYNAQELGEWKLSNIDSMSKREPARPYRSAKEENNEESIQVGL